jgi:hypothetical protein
MNAPYRILSLDGGGIWALVQVRTLQRLMGHPDVSGHEVLSQFDLVAANSGGSLVLAGLLENLPLNELLDLFLEKSGRIFVPNAWPWHQLYNWLKIGPRYRTTEKLAGLRAVLPRSGRKTLQELHAELPAGPRRPHLMICGFEYDDRRGVFFRSDSASRAQSHELARLVGFPSPPRVEKVTLAEAVHASSNAPINFFNRPANVRIETNGVGTRHLFWDGAVGGYNNPVLAAVVEALCNGHRAEDVAVLSLGTGGEFLPEVSTDVRTESPELVRYQTQSLGWRMGIPRFVSDVKKLSTSILSDPPDAASFVAYTLLFQRELTAGTLRPSDSRFIRLSPLIQPVFAVRDGRPRWELPEGFSAEDFRLLKKYQLDAVTAEAIRLIGRFTDGWLLGNVPNQPVRAGEYLKPILGYGRFAEGEAAWRTWT